MKPLASTLAALLLLLSGCGGVPGGSGVKDTIDQVVSGDANASQESDTPAESDTSSDTNSSVSDETAEEEETVPDETETVCGFCKTPVAATR